MSRRQRRHQAAHFQRLQPIAPAKIALDACSLQGLLQGVGGEDAKNHRDASVPGHGGHALADLRHHYIEMGCVTTDHGPQGDDHLVATAGRQALGHQGNFETAGHPGHIQLATAGGHINAVAAEAIKAAAEQLARDQIIETGDNHGDA